jgi:hypothetical protein
MIQNVKLAIGAGKGGGISGAANGRSGGAAVLRLGRTKTGLARRSTGLGGTLAAAVRFTSALIRGSLPDLPPDLRLVFRSGRAFAIEHPTLLATPSAVNCAPAT